jgi:hypothetical protein
VKVNGSLFMSRHIDDIFIHSLCSNTGMAIASTMPLEYITDSLAAKVEATYRTPLAATGETRMGASR